MASTNLSGATKVVIDAAGNSFGSANAQTIDGKYIHEDTGVEVDDPATPENPKGGKLYGGQLGTVTVQTSDQDVKAQLETWRTGYTNVDVRFKIPDGTGGTQNKDYLDCEWLDLREQPNFAEHGSVNRILAEVRTYADNAILG